MGSPPLYAGVLSCDSDFGFRMQFPIARLHGLLDEHATLVLQSASAVLSTLLKTPARSWPPNGSKRCARAICGASAVDDSSAAPRARRSFQHADQGTHHDSEADSSLLVGLMPSGSTVARQWIFLFVEARALRSPPMRIAHTCRRWRERSCALLRQTAHYCHRSNGRVARHVTYSNYGGP